MSANVLHPPRNVKLQAFKERDHPRSCGAVRAAIKWFAQDFLCAVRLMAFKFNSHENPQETSDII